MRAASTLKITNSHYFLITKHKWGKNRDFEQLKGVMGKILTDLMYLLVQFEILELVTNRDDQYLIKNKLLV